MFSRLGTKIAILLATGPLLSCGGGNASMAEATPQAAALNWYSTCGDPVCSGYAGPFAGEPLCTTQKAGDGCPTAGAQCDPQNQCNARLVCAAKDPKLQVGGCPVSRAQYKRDIRYLSDAQKAQIHAEVQRLRLATYRYRGAGPEAPQRLGFLIDDVERSASSTLGRSAVDAERDQVDLYGYTSMVVAALQVQAAQIEALQAEVKALREGPGPRARKAR